MVNGQDVMTPLRFQERTLAYHNALPFRCLCGLPKLSS
jgi:hypothetical protein